MSVDLFQSVEVRRKRIEIPADLALELQTIGGTVEQGIEKICKKLFTPRGQVFITTTNKATACRTNARKGKS